MSLLRGWWDFGYQQIPITKGVCLVPFKRVCGEEVQVIVPNVRNAKGNLYLQIAAPCEWCWHASPYPRRSRVLIPKGRDTIRVFCKACDNPLIRISGLDECNRFKFCIQIWCVN